MDRPPPPQFWGSQREEEAFSASVPLGCSGSRIEGFIGVGRGGPLLGLDSTLSASSCFVSERARAAARGWQAAVAGARFQRTPGRGMPGRTATGPCHTLFCLTEQAVFEAVHDGVPARVDDVGGDADGAPTVLGVGAVHDSADLGRRALLAADDADAEVGQPDGGEFGVVFRQRLAESAVEGVDGAIPSATVRISSPSTRSFSVASVIASGSPPRFSTMTR